MKSRSCRCCKKVFPASTGRVFCSESCRAAYKAAYGTLKKEVRRCAECGNAFVARSTNHKYCSPECLRQVTRQTQQSYRENHSSPYLKMRFKVLARDGFRCRYCGKSAQDKDARLVVDHILPKDAGGKDELSNLITACEECNLGKGALLLLVRKRQIPSYFTIETF